MDSRPPSVHVGPLEAERLAPSQTHPRRNLATVALARVGELLKSCEPLDDLDPLVRRQLDEGSP